MRIFSMLALIALGNCQSGASSKAPIDEETIGELASCSGGEFYHLVGEERSALSGVYLPSGVRIIGPDDVVTMDYVETRLNIRIDDRGRISEIYCG